MFSFIFENWCRSHMHPGVGAESNGVGRGVLVNFNLNISSHTLRIKHLVTQFLVLPPLRPVGSALASGLLVFDALWSLDFQVQGLEPKRIVETDNFK